MLYRMVFGQSHQEDLIARLCHRLSPAEAEQIAHQLQIRLAPRPLAEASL